MHLIHTRTSNTRRSLYVLVASVLITAVVATALVTAPATVADGEHPLSKTHELFGNIHKLSVSPHQPRLPVPPTPASSSPSSIPPAPQAPPAPVPPPLPPTDTVASMYAAVQNDIQIVEASGLRPSAGWTWSIGNAAAACNGVAGSDVTGCTTYTGDGPAFSVFGPPSPPGEVYSGLLQLVAHEIGNSVAAVATYGSAPTWASTFWATDVPPGSSWGLNDAISNCLTMYYLGPSVDTGNAGPFICPVNVADQIVQDLS